MSTTAPSLPRALVLAFATLVLGVTILPAQQFDNPVNLPVVISGTWTTVGVPPEPEEPEPSEAGWLEFEFGGYDYSESTWENDTHNILPGVADLELNRPYTIFIDSQYISELELVLVAPPGYRLRLLDGPVSLVGTYVHDLLLENPGVSTVTVVLERVRPRGKAPAMMSRPTTGNLLWSVSLGRLANGSSAGQVSLAAPEVDPGLFTPEWLQAVDLGDLVDVVRDGCALKQVRFPGGLLVVEVPSGLEDEALDLLWYAEADVDELDNGLYPLIGTPDPWFIHEIRKVGKAPMR